MNRILNMGLILLCAASFSMHVSASDSNPQLSNHIHFKLGNIQVYIWMTEDESLKIRASLNENSNISNLKMSPFYISKKVIPIKILKTKKDYQIGNYRIAPDRNGFTVFYRNEKCYRSEFLRKGNYLKEIKNCFDRELFYGMGQSSDRFALYRTRIDMYQEARYGDRAYMAIPFFFSNGGDGFYYDANTKDMFSFKDKYSAQVHYLTESNHIQYYFHPEKNLKSLISWFYTFSNSKALLPKWAFGYIQSKYGYKSEAEVYAIVNQFKSLQIPISAIVLDLYWFKHMGDLDYHPNHWPNPLKMDQFLEKNGIKLITISEPFYTVDSKNYNSFKNHGLFALNKLGTPLTWKDWWCFKSEKGSIINPIAPGSAKIIGSLYLNMMDKGIDAFWTDLGEPERTPEQARFNQYSKHEFHNYFNREWSRLIHQSISEKYPDRRLFILSRSGWTGSAGYGVSVWSGDVRSDFYALDIQSTLGINAGLTGFSYWGSDVGGFESGGKIPARELFIRWMQFGTFSPVFRAHGAMSSREPWIHGEETTRIIKKYIQLRYRLMPYIYSSAFQTYKEGLPIMRPMLLEHPDDPHELVNDRLTQYYFGDYLLVAPVTSPLNEAEDMEIYLPEGEWYEFESLKRTDSGLKSQSLTIESIPVYVKGGAIIPMNENDRSVILLAPSTKSMQSKFTWYHDDGISNQYKKGIFEAIDIYLSNQEIVFNNVKNVRPIRLKILKAAIKNPRFKTKSLHSGPFYLIDTILKPGRTKIRF